MRLFKQLGSYTLLLYKAVRSATEVSTYWRNLIQEMVKTGFDSLPIILITGTFTGAVMTIQTSYQLLAAYIPRSTIGAIVTQSLTIELGIIIPSLILSGRVGARIATELGSMRVSEQIDALEVMGFNSVTFLVVPRVLAGIVMFPMVYIITWSTGITGGILSGIITGQLEAAVFLQGAREFFFPWDMSFGFMKSIVFGFVITSIACFKGYYAEGGAEGVGRATTDATVLSCIFLLLADFSLAAILL
jgi:phospholipid/cholesterol/gamma-HCH transport system permease protein